MSTKKQNGRISLRTFHQKINELETLILERNLKGDIEGNNLSNLLKENENLKNFLQKDLKVAAGVFGIADRQKDFYITLQPTELQVEYGAIEIPRRDLKLPFTHQEIESRLVDFLFMIYRRDRLLSQGPPEFLGAAIKSNESRVKGVWSEQKQFPSCKTQIRLNKENSNILLYVEAAEIFFFHYAWRWLLRFAQRYGLKATPDPDNSLHGLSSESKKSFWDKGFWEKLTEEEMEGLPELKLINSIKEYREELKILKEGERKEFLKTGLNQWELVSQSLDGPIDNDEFGFSSEWIALGLLDDQKKGTKHLRGLLTFIIYEARIFRRDPNYREIAQAIDLLCREDDKEASRSDVVGMEYEELMKSGIESALRKIILFLLLSNQREREIEKTPVFKFLKYIHQLAEKRFLLIPYYYSVTLTQCPLDHLVLGVWNSFKYPLKWNPPLVEENEIGIPQVVHAIVGTCDSPELKRSTEGYQGYLTKLSRHINLIHIFMRRLAHPLIDAFFYGNIVEKESKDRGSKDTRGAFGHQIRPIANLLTNQWISDIDNFFDCGGLVHGQGKPNKLGEIFYYPGFEGFKDSLAVAPFKSVIDHGGKTMHLWTMTESISDIDWLQKDEDIIPFKDFLEHCLNYARNSLFAYGFRNIAIKKGLLRFRTLKEKFEELLEKQKLVYPKNNELQYPSIGVINDNAGDTLWLARLFIIIFQSCIEHGDIFKPIEIYVENTANDYFQFTVINSKRVKDTDELFNQFHIEYMQDLKEDNINKEQIDILVTCLNLTKKVGVNIDPKDTHSEDVARLCTGKLQGDLEWAKDIPSSKIRTTVKCRYQLKKVEERIK